MNLKRIQRKRTRGWRMPENAVYVGRPTKWGNPYPVKTFGSKAALDSYEKWLVDRLNEDPKFLEPLEGFDLACWCPLDKPCHVDVLLKFFKRMKT